MPGLGKHSTLECELSGKKDISSLSTLLPLITAVAVIPAINIFGVLVYVYRG